MEKEIDIREISRKFTWPRDERSRKLFGFIIRKALKTMDVKKIILYGSRARKDSNKFSDYDIAIDTDTDFSTWARFSLEIEDNVETLLPVDVVQLNSVNPELKNRIERDGKVLYDKKG